LLACKWLTSALRFRPYFTYWVTFVQLVIFIVSVSVYGFAPIGFGKKIESQDVLVTALYPKTIGFEEPENFWIGPRQVSGQCGSNLYKYCSMNNLSNRFGIMIARSSFA